MITDEERTKRFAESYFLEKDSPEKCLWLSFCDIDKPSGSQFVGVIITFAKGTAHAIKKTHELGINLGGEILCYETNGIDEKYLDRLLTKEDLIQAGYID